MKNINKISQCLIVAVGIFCFACNDEWKDEQYEKTVSFVRSEYTDVYLKYGTEGGIVPYKIPLVIGGSTANDVDVEVTIALDPDTLKDMNFDRFRLREDLYFRQLEPQFYEFKSMKTVIPKGSDIGILDINFKLTGLDLVEKYVLPIQIVATSHYMPSPHRGYKKSMMRIIPFNDYSGTYKPSSGTILFEGQKDTEGKEISIPLEDWREARVVNENTIFFYAGYVEEQARDRALYKIRAQFNEDMTITLTADNAEAIKFQPISGSYYIMKTTDPKIPYLEYRYVTMDLDYRYSDTTNPGYPLVFRIAGSYTMERKRNIMIPEEDDIFIFD